MNEDPTDVLGRRVAAGLIDLLIVFVLLVLVGIVFGQTATSDSGASVSLEGVSIVVFLLCVFLYYGALEAMSGQTIGKRVMSIRVVSADGGDASGGQIALRTLLRLIDGILLYLVGLVVILLTGRRRARLGDLAGRTTVVRA